MMTKKQGKNYFIRSDGKKIEILHKPYCEKCSLPVPSEYTQCVKCHNYPDPIYFEARAVGLYRTDSEDDTLTTEIGQLKQDSSLAEILGECMVYAMENRFPHLKNVDFIVAVPPADKKRGYNQTMLLAEYISRKINIPVIDPLFFTEDYRPQVGLGFSERIENPKGKVKIIENTKLDGKKILIIDDLFTTGGTLNECCKVLLEHGASEVKALVLGRATDDRHLKFVGYI